MSSRSDVNLVIVGNNNVGKTSLFFIYTTNAFPDHYEPVAHEYLGNVLIDEKPVSVRIRDTDGENHRIRPLHYPGSDVVMLTFSVDDYDSFESIQSQFYPEVAYFCPNVPVVLVGCKADLRNNDSLLLVKSLPMVTYKEASDYAQTQGIVYLETSSRTQSGMKECFEFAIRTGLNYRLYSSKQKRFFSFRRSKKHKEILIPPLLLPADKAPWPTVEPSSFADDWLKVLRDPRFYDVTFVMENGRRHDAHKIVLCSASKIFSRLFCSSFGDCSMTAQEQQITAIQDFTQQDLNSSLVEGITTVQDEDPQKPANKRKTTIVLSDDIKPATFHRVLEFLYTGVPKIPEDASEEEVKDLSCVARIFKLSQLETICHYIENNEKYPNLNINDETGAIMKKCFLNQPNCADVVFNVMGTPLYAHRVVLTARNEVMAAMFSGQFKEGDDQEMVEINIEGTTVENFLALLEYLYTDHAPIEEADVIGILILADEYCVKRLCSLCELYIAKEIDRRCSKQILNSDMDVIGLLNTAQIYNATQLVNWCLHFISTNYMEFEMRAEFSNLTTVHRKFVDEHRWPPLSYLEKMAEYEKKTKDSSDKCNVM